MITTIVTDEHVITALPHVTSRARQTVYCIHKQGTVAWDSQSVIVLSLGNKFRVLHYHVLYSQTS